MHTLPFQNLERATFRDKSSGVTPEGYNAGLAVIEMVAVGERYKAVYWLIPMIHAYVDVSPVPNHLLH